MDQLHGGDIYRNQIELDFSVNLNPLGMPESVREALYRAVEHCRAYPDLEAAELKKALSRYLHVPTGYLLLGSGASELFMAIVHGLRPKKVLIPVPSFYGYEYVAGAAGSEIIWFFLKQEEEFMPGEGLLEALTEEIDLLFLANPNNPTGKRLDRDYLFRLLDRCRQKGIRVVLDECFLEFCGEGLSLAGELADHPHLILVGAFTKSFSLPGVRIGYGASADKEVVRRIQRQFPEWNLSTFAQQAGVACTKERAFLEKTRRFIEEERQFLSEKLTGLGLKVFSSNANFLLVYSELPLYEKLLEQKILIRDCSGFRGLTEGYYRIAVKQRKENQQLIEVVGEYIGKNRAFTTGRD